MVGTSNKSVPVAWPLMSQSRGSTRKMKTKQPEEFGDSLKDFMGFFFATKIAIYYGIQWDFTNKDGDLMGFQWVSLSLSIANGLASGNSCHFALEILSYLEEVR